MNQWRAIGLLYYSQFHTLLDNMTDGALVIWATHALDITVLKQSKAQLGFEKLIIFLYGW